MRSRTLAALLVASGLAFGASGAVRAQDPVAPRPAPPPDPFGGDVAPTWSQSALAGFSPITLLGTLRVQGRPPGALVSVLEVTHVVRPGDTLTLSSGQGAGAIEVTVEVVEVRAGALLLRTVGPDAAPILVR